MSKKQSKQCRFGSQCHEPKCAFKHPPKNVLDESDETKKIVREDDQKESEARLSNFISSALQMQHMDSLFSGILYTGWSEEEPYAIETYPELGTFATWNDACDALLDYVYLGIGETIEFASG
jgi:hypothetical protein